MGSWHIADLQQLRQDAAAWSILRRWEGPRVSARRRARGDHHGRSGGAEQATSGGQDPQAGKGVPEKTAVFFARKGLGELLQAHRGGEDELPRPVRVPDAAGRFQERLLWLERQAIFGKQPSGCRSHREDSGGPRTQPQHVRISEGPRRVEGARDSLLSQTGREAHARERTTGLHARQEEGDHSSKQEEGRSFCRRPGEEGFRGHTGRLGLGGVRHLRRHR